MKVDLKDIQEAKNRINSYTKETELDFSSSSSKHLGQDVFFKFENTQWTGSFKIRGASNKILSLSDSERAKGVIASSAGNHAQGVALSATKAGIKSVICMPENAPLVKVQATRNYGAEVILQGEMVDDSHTLAKKLVQEKGYIYVHPYEDEKVIAGQGTIGLEIMNKMSDLDTVIVPIGGGGLISGMAVAIKSINPNCRVIGVQAEKAPGMKNLFRKETISTSGKYQTIADGIAIKQPSKVMYDSFISKYVDDVVTVNDDQIADAIVFLLERAKAVSEGAGAVGLAAALHNKIKLGQRNCILISGGNIDLNIVAKIIEKGLTYKGRLFELAVIVDDLPGNLSRLTQVMAQKRANVIEVHHDRVSKGLNLREARIEFVLETTGFEHIEEIKKAVSELGAKVV